MSAQEKKTSINIKEEIIIEIDRLDISFIQKHHLRLLTHCLEIFKYIASNNEDISPSSEFLKKWCDSQGEKFDDKKFSKLLLEQMNAALIKIKEYSQTVDKDILDLDLQDLIKIIKLTY